jgi:hypothetical protein
VYHFYEVSSGARPRLPGSALLSLDDSLLCCTRPQVYKDAEAAALHKTLPHYKLWAEFKAKHMETIGASQKVTKFEMVGDS